MVRDRGGRGARRGTAVRAGVGRGCGPPPRRSTARRRDERHAAQRRGERRLADVRAQLLEQPLLPPEDDQHRERQEPRPARRLHPRVRAAWQLRDHADRRERGHVHHVARDAEQHRARLRPAHAEDAVALRAQERAGEHGVLRPQQPRRRGVGRLGVRRTLDDYLVALDATTGKVKWEVKVGDGPEAGYTETMAPLVIGDNVIIGTSGAEYGIRGYVKSFNAATGAAGWTWYTLPSPEEGGWWGKWSKTTGEGDDLHRDIAKEKADSAKHSDAWKTGGGSMWMTPAYDADTKTLYVAIGNPSPDLDGSIRPGDNLWTESIVAINATNGEFKWGYQEVPHDVWDLDAVSPPVIAMVGGKKAVVEAGKTGFVYVLDAATGKLIRRSAAFVPQQNMYTQPTADGVFMLPGANGGQEWSPIAVHPDLAYAYTVGLHQPMHYKVHYAPWEKGRLWLGSAFVRVPDDKGGYSGEYGNVNAIDLNTGKIAWTVKTELPMMGGATATAGGLVFTGEGNGWFKAYDARTGAVLWKFYCGAGVNAAPSVYELDGEQFIAVAAGGNFQISYPLGNSVFVFGLPKAGM